METDDAEAPNVISMERHLRSKDEPDRARVIAVTSGKGGVGKSSTVVNLGISLQRLGKRVLAMDADLGLGNLDILMGIAPRHNLSHVIRNEIAMADIILEGPEGLRLLPAASGVREMAELPREVHCRILSELDALLDDVDVVLVDTGPGLSSAVLHFNGAAGEVLVVTTPEPAAITDAYALIKTLVLLQPPRPLHLLVNAAGSLREGQEVCGQLQRVSQRFLGMSPRYLGCVLRDDCLIQALRKQQAVVKVFPDSRSGRGYEALARRLLRTPPPPAETAASVWRHFRTE